LEISGRKKVIEQEEKVELASWSDREHMGNIQVNQPR